jgi:hypothetical protein
MRAAMLARRLVLLAFFVYVAIDLGCPLIPGAFTFDADESVEAVSTYRARPPALPRVTLVPAAMTSGPLRAETPAYATEASTLPSRPRWRSRAGRDHVRASEPRPPVDDD